MTWKGDMDECNGDDSVWNMSAYLFIYVEVFKGQAVLGQRGMALNRKRSNLEEEIEGGKSLEQVAQKSCKCSIPGSIQARLARALVWWKMSLPTSGGLKLLDLYGPFLSNPNHSIRQFYCMRWLSTKLLIQICSFLLSSLQSTQMCR